MQRNHVSPTGPKNQKRQYIYIENRTEHKTKINPLPPSTLIYTQYTPCLRPKSFPTHNPRTGT